MSGERHSPARRLPTGRPGPARRGTAPCGRPDPCSPGHSGDRRQRQPLACSRDGVSLGRPIGREKGAHMQLEGRTALVTGATGGIGHAIARALAARRAKLVLTGRQTEVLGRLARELDAQVFSVDLADHRALQHLIERTEDVDILIANAALPASGQIADLTADEIDAALDVNLRAPILLARSLAMRMAARGSGHLVFINSLSG